MKNSSSIKILNLFLLKLIQRNNWFCEKEFIKCACLWATAALANADYLVSFFFEHIQGLKNSLVDSFTYELASLIIRVKLLSKREEIQNAKPLLLGWLSHSCKVLMDILEFHMKARSLFSLLSSTYPIVHKFNILDIKQSMWGVLLIQKN